MKIITLNDREATTVTNRDFYMEVVGLSKPEAVKAALNDHEGRPSKQFVEWLSEGDLTVDHGSITTAA